MSLLHRISVLLFLGAAGPAAISCGGAEPNGTGGASAASASATSSSVSSSAQSSTAASTSASSTGASSSSSGGGSGVERGPKAIDLTIDPNALLWDAPSSTLYLADDIKNQLLKWTDKGGFAVVADLPPAPTMMGAGNGQLVRLKDGTFVIPRFGFGTNGDVVVVHPNLMSEVVPNLDPARRRIGLALAPDGTLYVGGFVKTGPVQAGFISVLDLTGKETDVPIMGLQKPVGVLIDNGALYVSDQTQKLIFKSDLATPAQTSVFNKLGTAPVDLLSAGPNGIIWSGGTMGQVYQVTSGGTLTVFYGGLQAVRGTAYDAAGTRLFAVDHVSSPGINHLYILPVNL